MARAPGYPAHGPLSYPTWLPAIRRIDGLEPIASLFFFFNAPWNKPSSTIDLGCREPSPSFQNGVGWEKSCNDRRNFRIYLAHGPSKQLLNISGTDNTSAEGKQRVVVFRRRNNPSQIKTRKQTRERDAERARVRKLTFTLPSPRLSSPSRS